MQVRMNKPWMLLTAQSVKRLSGQLGVYQIQDRSRQVVFIGYAGGRSLFGLRGELQRELANRAEDHSFRYEVTMQYMTRYKELLMVHVADHSQLPLENRSSSPQLGRMHPA